MSIFRTERRADLATGRPFLFLKQLGQVAAVLGAALLLSSCTAPPSPKNHTYTTPQAGVKGSNIGTLKSGFKPPLKPLWIIKGLGSVEGGIVSDKENFFIVTSQGETLKVRAKDGKVLWRVLSPTRQKLRATPALLEDLVCTGDNEGWVRCLDQKNGKQKWAYKTGEAIQAPLKVQGKILVVNSQDKQAYAFEPLNGKLLWTYPTGYWLKSAAGLDKKDAAISGLDGKVRLLDLKSGSLIWDNDIGVPFFSAPLIAQDMVIAHGWDNTVRAFHQKSGNRLWQKTLEGMPGAAGMPALAGERLLLGTMAGYLHALDIYSGKLLWTFKSPGGFSSPPVVTGNTAWIGGYNHFLYGINVQTGKRQWYHNLRGDIISPVSIAGGILAVGTKKGRVYAFVEAN